MPRGEVECLGDLGWLALGTGDYKVLDTQVLTMARSPLFGFSSQPRVDHVPIGNTNSLSKLQVLQKVLGCSRIVPLPSRTDMISN